MKFALAVALLASSAAAFTAPTMTFAVGKKAAPKKAVGTKVVAKKSSGVKMAPVIKGLSTGPSKPKTPIKKVGYCCTL